MAAGTGGILLAAMVFCWSSGFIGYRYAAEDSGVMVVTFWRFVAAAALLLPFVASSLKAVAWRSVGSHLLIGLFGIAGYIAPIAASIKLGVAPGTSSLIANLLPLSIVLTAGLVPGQKTQGWQWLGVGLCVAGMLLASGASLELGKATVWAYCMPSLAVLSLTAATIYQRKSMAPKVPALTGLFIQVCATLPVFAVLAMLEGTIAPVMEQRFSFAILWLVVLGTLGGYGFYWLCLGRFTLQSVSGALFLTPPVTMIWAHLQFGDTLNPWAFAGITLTLIALPLLRTDKRACTKKATVR
jgi:drug/metabolite transporter (DMT)-like permease